MKMNKIMGEFVKRTHSRYLKASTRANWDDQFRKVSKYVTPQSDFFNTSHTSGERRYVDLFDGTAPQALERFAAALEGYICPSTKLYHGLTVPDPVLAHDPEVKQYLEDVVKVLFKYRYKVTANFQSQINEFFKSLGAFGNSVISIIDDKTGPGYFYRTIPLSETWFLDNHAGLVDTIFRKLTLTNRQAFQRWGESAGPKVMVDKELMPDVMNEYIQAYLPMEELPLSEQLQGFVYVCITFSMDEETTLIEKTGFYTQPMIAGRYATFPGDVYGYGPAMICLSEISVANQIKKTVLRKAHKDLDPPMLTTDDGVITQFKLTPGGITPGGLTSDGRPLLVPLASGGNLQLAEFVYESARRAINDAFLVSLFDMFKDNQPQKTATEILAWTAEKGVLLGPIGGRIQSEVLGNCINREMDILNRQGMLPQMPESLRASRQPIKVTYESPLTQAQEAGAGQDILNYISALGQMKAFAPNSDAKVDYNQVSTYLAEILRIPVRILKSDEQIAQEAQAAKQASDQQALMQNAGGLGSAIKDISAVGQLGGGGQAPPGIAQIPGL